MGKQNTLNWQEFRNFENYFIGQLPYNFMREE